MITAKIKQILTDSGCTLVIYEQDKLANLYTDQSDQFDIIGVIMQPNEITLEVKANAILEHYNPLTIDIISQVRLEDTADNNEVRLQQLLDICKDIIVRLIYDSQLNPLEGFKFKPLTITKVLETKYDANVIGWTMPLDLIRFKNEDKDFCIPPVLPIALVAPIAFSVTVFSFSQINLAWVNNPSGQDVVIERSLDGNTFVEIYRTIPGAVTYSNTGLTAGTRYYYRIRAFSGTDYSVYTNVEDAVPTLSIGPGGVVDTHTVAWFIADDLTTITKDGSNFVSMWNDKMGTGHDLLQATGTNQPLWSATGILFDGIDNFMKCVAFTLIRPTKIYIVLNQKTWTINDVLFDGNAIATGQIIQWTSTPNIRASGGVQSSSLATLAVNTWGIIRLTFGTIQIGSSFKHGINIPAVGGFGTNNMNGFTLGANGTPGAYGNVEVKEIIIRNIDDNSIDDTLIYNYLKTKYTL
jgi:hypothetical protein